MKKVALLGPKDWALGNINFFLKKYLSENYSVCLLDWSHSSHVMFALGGSFDVVISEASIVNVEDIGHKISDKTVLMPVFHHDPVKLNGTHFDENHEKNIKKHRVYSITSKISKSVFDRYGVVSEVLPIGVDDSFWAKRNIKSIKNIGICYRPSVALSPKYEEVKRFWMFDEIRKKINLDASVVWGKNFLSGSDIYGGCDLVICTSVEEGLPTSFLECAASKIPYISTDVGIVSDFNEVMKFNTVDEACSIIEMFLSNPDFISVYVDSIHESVVNSLNWRKVVNEFWIPAIENALK